MHALQPRHIKLKQEEVTKLLEKYNISISQLPKISFGDPALPKDCVSGDVVKIEREQNGKIQIYYRTVAT